MFKEIFIMMNAGNQEGIERKMRRLERLKNGTEYEELTEEIIGGAIEVQRRLWTKIYRIDL